MRADGDSRAAGRSRSAAGDHSVPDALRAHQDELNRLNVYPVPDGDTGTNMTLTLESVVNELGTAEDMAEVCQAVAHGSLMGAAGTPGVILSQVLRGLADTFRNLEAAGAGEFAVGLRQASDAAYEAVMRPVGGDDPHGGAGRRRSRPRPRVTRASRRSSASSGLALGRRT